MEQTWHYYIMIWHCRNGKLHGHNFEESWQKVMEMTRQEAQAMYMSLEGNVTDNA